MAWMNWMPFSQPRRTWGILLLGVWLVVSGMQRFHWISGNEIEQILAGLAVASGVLILLNR